MIIFTWLFNLLKIVVILGTLITIHELGHFIVAKLCDVKVNKFSIGFGPKLLKKTSGETEYTLRLIPFGGFVQMEGEEQRSENERSFNNKKIWQRIAIVAAGAIVNIVFALLIYFTIASANNMYYSTEVIGLTEGPLYEAGIRSGDVILKVNDEKVLMLGNIEKIIEDSKSDDFVFTIQRSGEVIEIPVTIPFSEKGYLGVAFSASGEIAYLINNTPAAELGLLPGDVAIAINDKECSNSTELVDAISKLKNAPITIDVVRNGEVIKVEGTTGTLYSRVYSLNCVIIEPGFWKGFKYACASTEFYLTETVVGTFKIFIGKAENVEVMGPIGIAEKISETSAWQEFFTLMSAISLSLGIFNLIPIPALDGGRILILIIEGIRRKPMKESVEQGLIMAGFMAIILLALVITISDVIKLF